MVRYAGEHNHQRLARQGSDRARRRHRRAPQPDGDDAAMQREAGDPVQHGAARHMDRHARGHGFDQLRQRPHAVLGEENRFDCEASPRERCAQHHLALDHEAPAAPLHVPVTDVAIGLDARVGDIGDGNERAQASKNPCRVLATLTPIASTA
jgi:hypothetical protein